MKNKMLSILKKYLIPAVFWLGLWQIASQLIGREFLLPGIPATLSALVGLIGDGDFYLAVLFSALRVLIGLTLGTLIGFGFALLCDRYPLFRDLISPMMTVIKSTPVASFILVLWVLMSGDALSVFIGFLMVMPIVYQNITDGLSAVDKDLSEVAFIFNFSRSKRFLLLTMPTLRGYLFPAIITASGLAWKAEIAAEVIAYTKNSIGQGINDAKYNMETPTVFAWTAVIIVLSILLEKSARALMRRYGK